MIVLFSISLLFSEVVSLIWEALDDVNVKSSKKNTFYFYLLFISSNEGISFKWRVVYDIGSKKKQMDAPSVHYSFRMEELQIISV